MVTPRWAELSQKPARKAIFGDVILSLDMLLDRRNMGVRIPREVRMARRQSTGIARAPASAQSRVVSDFPKHTLQQALRVAQGIHDRNGGRPLPPTETAIAIGLSPGSSDFRVLLSSSIKYGLTAGSFNVERVSIDTLGQEIVEPKDADDRTRALVEAALAPTTFRAIYDAFRGKKLPDAEFFRNAVVREFGVPREHAEKCVEIFLANVEYLGLATVTPTGRWLSSHPSGRVNVAAPSPSIPQNRQEESDTATSPVRSTGEEPSFASRPKGHAIFVGHGKLKGPLDQLVKFLAEYHIPYKVAVDEANEGRPISAKVAEIMQACSAAILIFTPDEEHRSTDCATVWKPSDNVVYELGAASVLYGRQVVIFKEESVTFPTNFRDLGYISFKGDDLNAKTHELLRELIAFKLVKLSVG